MRFVLLQVLALLGAMALGALLFSWIGPWNEARGDDGLKLEAEVAPLPCAPCPKEPGVAKAASAVGAEVRADVHLLSDRLTASSSISVAFSVDPPHAQDWMTVVPVGTPDNSYRQWFYTKAATEGVLSFNALPAGSYEARLYLNWPQGGYTVAARAPFEVLTEP